MRSKKIAELLKTHKSVVVCERNDDYSLRNIEFYNQTPFGVKNYPISFGLFSELRYNAKLKLIDTDECSGYFFDTYILD